MWNFKLLLRDTFRRSIGPLNKRNVLSFFPVITINNVTIFTSFEPYLSSLSQNPKYAKACKASMKARQNVTRGISSSALLAEKWISSGETSQSDFFYKRAIERLCASDGHKSEITEILDLCDYDYIL